MLGSVLPSMMPTGRACERVRASIPPSLFPCRRVNEDLGLTFPEDYGVIAAFQWLPNLVLLVGLTNGYMVTVDFGALIKLQQSHKLPDRVSAMGTSKV